VEQRQFLCLVDVDEFGHDLVVGLVFDAERVEAFDGFGV